MNSLENCSLKIKDDSKETEISKFYFIVNTILDREKISKNDYNSIFKKKQKKLDNFSDNELRHKYVKISDLFEYNNSNIIGKFFIILYDMNYESTKSLINLLTTYEQDIFNIFLKFYTNDKPENIDKYISFINSVNFYTDELVILHLEADKKYVSRRIDQFKNSTKTEEDRLLLESFNNTILVKEKEKFLAINYFVDQIKRDEIVDEYQRYIQEINDLFIEDEKERKKNRIEKEV
jgi:hypothetical protein